MVEGKEKKDMSRREERRGGMGERGRVGKRGVEW